MSTQPGDPSPRDTPPPGREGQTDPPPPGFFSQVAALFANRNARILLAIVAILLVLLGIAMVSSIEGTYKGPGTA